MAANALSVQAWGILFSLQSTSVEIKKFKSSE